MQRHSQNEPNYVRGDLTKQKGVGSASPEEIARRLKTTLSDPSYSPPLLPTVALEVVALSKDPKVDLGQVRKLIETDPLLAGKVIQLAQSSFYSRGASVRSLDGALARLGTRALADLFLQVAVTTRVFRAKGFEEPMAAIRRHSVACAHLVRKVCQKTGFPQEYAFLCGLLHDCGMAAGIIILSEGPRGQKPPSYEDLRDAVESVHSTASEVLATAWHLPMDVRLALRHHHTYLIGGKVHPLLGALCVADALAIDAGLGIGHEQPTEVALHAAHAIGISAVQLAELGCQAKELAEMLE